MHKLMIKTHKVTGLKYLCYTQVTGEEYKNYKGSGTYWKRHLKKHGDDITTELIFETEDVEEFKRMALQKSFDFNIVESNEWANLQPEQGTGGDTVSNRRWITDGVTDKYHYKTLPIPEGWRAGRSNCVFNDPASQAKFGQMGDLKTRGAAIKKAWADGKMDHRVLPDISGEKNPMYGKKRSLESRLKQSNTWTKKRNK